MATKTGGWATNDVPTAAEINTYFQQRDAWTSYTPTLTNVTTGNGTLTGYYNQQGRIVDFFAKFQLGSTSSVTGTIGITVPVAGVRSAEPFAVHLYDASAGGATGLSLGSALWGSTTRLDLVVFNAAGTYLAGAYTSGTVPWTWTTSDFFAISGTYEAATAP